jgi:hypothetical protein
MIISVTSAQKNIKEIEKDETNENIILKNNPPTDPEITCPDTIKQNRMFIARAVSVDPDGDKIYYRLKAGESGNPSNWIGPRESGVEYATGWGIFDYYGEIVIGFQAKDEWGLSSDWSYHTLNILKLKTRLNFLSLINILQKNSRIFHFLTILQ